jgi:hypothetical protein
MPKTLARRGPRREQTFDAPATGHYRFSFSPCAMWALAAPSRSARVKGYRGCAGARNKGLTGL